MLLGAFGFAWSNFSVLATPLHLVNGGLTADVGQVAALGQGCSEFALFQDKERKPILRHEGELFFTELVAPSRVYGKGHRMNCIGQYQRFYSFD